MGNAISSWAMRRFATGAGPGAAKPAPSPKKTAASPPPEKLTIGVLYGFRALMVLAVCNYHIWQLGWLPQYIDWFGTRLSMDFFARGSYLFVDGMLLMSGFLLYLPYAREKAEGIPAPRAGQFYWNRLVRILPSYLLSVLVVLLFFALPQGAYRDAAAMRKDIWTHLTFTYTFFTETYLQTPLNGALWTVAVEMQFYLLVPLLARGVQKMPVTTLGAMALAGFAYRGIVYFKAPDLGPLINQMPAFLDVYALGMLGAILYVRLRKLLQREGGAGLRRLIAGLSVPVFALAVYGIGALLRAQATASLEGIEALRRSQLAVRLPLALVMVCAMLSASLMPRLLQKLLDNRLLRFLSVISFNLYVWHQVLSAQMLKAFFPDIETLHKTLAQQQAYTLLCFSVSILAAMVATFGVEQPCARLLNRLWKNRRRNKNHEGPKAACAQPPADPVLLRAEERAAGAD